MKPETYFVWDVESIGLYGDGFAFGYVVIQLDEHGGYEVLEDGGLCCAPVKAAGTQQSRLWVAEHVSTHGLDEVSTPAVLRERFWDLWQRWRCCRAIMVADCPVPVEANFLAACVYQGDTETRAWNGAYPFLDVASMRFAVGLDPIEDCERLPDERPPHHPLCDARQSARLFVEALNRWSTR